MEVCLFLCDPCIHAWKDVLCNFENHCVKLSIRNSSTRSAKTPHSQLLVGFSMEGLIGNFQHIKSNCTAKRYKALALCVLSQSAPLSYGNPKRLSESRSGLGALYLSRRCVGSCFSRARLQVPHGKPKCSDIGLRW